MSVQSLPDPPSHRHQQLRNALERFKNHPEVVSIDTTIPLELRRPYRTAPRNGGHAMPIRALYSTRVEATRYSPGVEAVIVKIARTRTRRARRQARMEYARTFVLRLLYGGIVAVSALWFAGVLIRTFAVP